MYLLLQEFVYCISCVVSMLPDFPVYLHQEIRETLKLFWACSVWCIVVIFRELFSKGSQYTSGLQSTDSKRTPFYLFTDGVWQFYDECVLKYPSAKNVNVLSVSIMKKKGWVLAWFNQISNFHSVFELKICENHIFLHKAESVCAFQLKGPICDWQLDDDNSHTIWLICSCAYT